MFISDLIQEFTATHVPFILLLSQVSLQELLRFKHLMQHCSNNTKKTTTFLLSLFKL